MQPLTLNVKKREIVGKKVKKLRKEDILPGNIYGKDIKSENLSVLLKDFSPIYRKAGETGLIELKIDGKSHHTLISNVQINPVTRAPIHVEFHAVKLTEKIKTKVPVELIGESPAVQNGTGVLLHTLNEIEVEALPTNLPDKIEVDVSVLSNIDDQVTVEKLTLGKEIEILTSKDEIIVKVAPAVSEETKKELEAEAAAKAAAATEAAPAVDGEAAPAAQGETKQQAEAVKAEPEPKQ